jgi:predicted AlkP superfamily pyrophosphatase or phosphodiesterase
MFDTAKLLLAALVALLIPVASKSALAQSASSKPDLVVLIAVDQLGSLLFDRWRGSYRGGLKRIADESIVYSNGYQSHGITETCAGHSTLLTGKHPGRTGIVANEWYDATSGKVVYCVADAAYAQAHDAKARKVGPSLLATGTLGDWLKAQQTGSRVVVVSGKDRASIVMAGHKADAVFWYQDNVGFTTFVGAGEDAAAKLGPLATLNARIKSEAASVPDWNYAAPSCRSLEGEYTIGKQTWKSKLPPELPIEPGKPPRKARALHIMDPLTLEAARELVRHYELGRRGTTDLLAIGLSATDFVGHGYGTQGPEMCDQMHRLDELVGEFLTYLDGLGSKVLLVMTADHGGSDFPERLAQQGYRTAKRIDPKVFLAGVNAELKQQLSLADDPLRSPDFVQFYAVNKEGRQMEEPARSQVIEAGLKILKQRAEIEQACSLAELLSHRVVASAASDYTLKDRFSKSVMSGRSGDIIVAFKSGVSTARALPTRFIMGHAGPYHHDTAVPIIFWWPGATAQTRLLPVDTTAIAPTLANVMGVTVPGDLDGSCLDIGHPAAPKC